jgi:hypothetical protein
MKKQTAFSLAKSAEQRRQWDALFAKLTDAHQLDYAVLMAHVLIYDGLCDLLGVRLRTDSLPDRMPMFEVVSGLALAGERFGQDRETLAFLNAARNSVAHRADRSKFADATYQFAYRSCNDKNPEYHLEGFEWPSAERKRVENFCFGFFVWQAKLVDLVSEFENAVE